jgi:hypothetical protein
MSCCREAAAAAERGPRKQKTTPKKVLSPGKRREMVHGVEATKNQKGKKDEGMSLKERKTLHEEQVCACTFQTIHHMLRVSKKDLLAFSHLEIPISRI